MQIRPFHDKDEKDIRDLFSICFGRELSHEEWVWKYKASPWGSYATVAVKGDNIIAHYGGIRIKFYFKDKTVYAYQFCDVMTHPEYRGRLFSKTPFIAMLNEMFYREKPMDFAFGFPSLRHARLQCKRLGGEGYRHVRLYKKEHMKRRTVSWKLKMKEGWEFLTDKKVDKLLIQHDDKSLQIVKNKKYLKWRYMENPLKDYRLLVFKKLYITKGYIIFTLKDNWLNVLDFFLRDENDLKDMLISLEDYILKNLEDIRGIKAWFHPNESLIKYLEALGYSNEDDIPLIYRTVNDGCGVKYESFFENYFYRMGDYDDS